MGGACSKSTVQVGGRTGESDVLDRQLEESKAREELHFKILCLGAGESGKSTVIKQLTFIHKQQLTSEERLSYVKVLQNNTVQSMITLIKEAEAFGYSFSPEERLSADSVCQHDQRVHLPYAAIVDIDRLWQSEAIQLTWARRNEFWHLETTEYYFANAERYVSDGFVPTEEDIVMARKRTTGVVVTELDYGGVHWSCVDVGGQRSERRKWLNCFDNVKAIIYVVNLAGYCKVLFEDKAVNRMHESLNLFEATMSNPLFAHTPVFIFLNKKDLFEQLIRDRNIDCCFPDYAGPAELHPCIEYISEEYQRRLPAHAAKPTFLLLAARMKKDVQYCISAGTLIARPDGTSLPIERVRAGMTVLARSTVGGDGTKNQLVPRRVTCAMQTGIRPCVELLFDDGRTLECTADHRILSADGSWVQAGQLEVNQSEVVAGAELPCAEQLDIGGAWKVDLSLWRIKLVGRRPVGSKAVFDLTVPSEQGEDSASFVANGVVVHNCFEEVKDILLDSHKKSIVKAKKALERVEKRNREAGLAGELLEEAAEGKKESDTGKYKVRGLQGWEATRKPAKLPTKKVPVPSSAAGGEAARADEEAKEAKDEDAQATRDSGASVELAATTTPASHSHAATPASPSSATPQSPSHPVLPPSSSTSARDAAEQSATSLRFQSTAVHHAPRPSHSSTVGQPLGVTTPRTELRERGRSDEVAEDDHDQERSSRQDHEAKHSKMQHEETKEADERDKLLTLAHSSDAAIRTLSQLTGSS